MYINDDVSALYFNWNPTEGPFVIIPSLEQADKPCPFKLTSKLDNLIIKIKKNIQITLKIQNLFFENFFI